MWPGDHFVNAIAVERPSDGFIKEDSQTYFKPKIWNSIKDKLSNIQQKNKILFKLFYTVIIINNASTRLTKIIKEVILARIEGCNYTDVTQFLVEVALLSNMLGILTTVCLLFYVKVTCSCFVYGDGTRPRTFHSARYQIVPHNPKTSEAQRNR